MNDRPSEVSELGAEASVAARLTGLAGEIRQHGFVFVPGEEMLAMLSSAARRAWPAFAASWDGLGEDGFMADGGRYRRRRHAVFEQTPQGSLRGPHQPHYQSRDYNPLNGGTQRWFDPVLAATGENPVTAELLELSQALFAQLETPPRPRRHVEMHQFRIEPAAEGEGQPTPEGVHRDGVEWVCVLLVGRKNVERGVTTIYGPGGASLGSFTLQHPLDTVFLDDRRVAHGVTGIRRIEAAKPGRRDVLVLTFDEPRD